MLTVVNFSFGFSISCNLCLKVLLGNSDFLVKFRGHGTTEFNGEVVATVCGVVERVNKLVYVRSLRARYSLIQCA